VLVYRAERIAERDAVQLERPGAYDGAQRTRSGRGQEQERIERLILSENGRAGRG